MSGTESPIYGLVGEFAEADAAIAIARQLHADGVRHFDVYSPLPLDEVTELLPRRPSTSLALIMFAAALVGGAAGFMMQYVIAVDVYPLNIGGRPLDSWPAFIPIAWELCALITVYAGFVAFLGFCRLPMLYHPIFNATGFERASQDNCFVCVEARNSGFDAQALSALFHRHQAVNVSEVPR